MVLHLAVLGGTVSGSLVHANTALENRTYLKKVARMLKKHRPLLLNWFRAKGQFSNGVVEGFNTKAKLTTRKAYGFRTYHGAEIALYHTLGALPVPESAHRFC